MTHLISIEGRSIGPGQPCFLIGEIGINHNGEPETAIKMIDAIADAGADCVKFQTFKADGFLSNSDDTYEYKSQGKVVIESMMEMFKRAEIPYKEFKRFFAHARSRGLIPLSTPTDNEAVDALDEMGVGAFKVGSDDIVHTPFLKYIGKKGKPVIISTGMADTQDIERGISAIHETGNNNIIVLHCVSLYPTPSDKLNLSNITSINEQFPVVVGFSDHSQGCSAAVTAVSLGSSVVEKHFTLDRNMPGPDHWFAANPEELTNLVKAVRSTEIMMGSSKIKPSAEEIEMAKISRRSIVATRELTVGHSLSQDDVSFQRPGTGLMPYQIYSLLGRTITKPVASGELLRLEHFSSK